MSDNVRLRLSVGIVAVTMFHAVALGIVFAALHRGKPTEDCCEPAQIPRYDRPQVPQAVIQKLDQPQQVNLEAQGEVKQQAPCPPGFRPRRIVVRPRRVVTQPSLPTSVPTSSVKAEPEPDPSQGSTVIQSEEPPALENSTPETIATPASPPPKKSFEIALFVSRDAASRKLEEWFEEHAGLAGLAQSCEFQIYTKDNPIYRARFREIVPVTQFPVVLFQDSSGGHIHAAGRTMIPGSADQLFDDLKTGYELYKQAKEAQKTGAVKSRGYSWDDAISPTLYLSPEDCPDGYCPIDEPDVWRPNRPVDLPLFDQSSDSRNALMWLSAGELATLALIALAVFLLGFILIKRGM